MRDPIHQLLAGKFVDGVLWHGHRIEVYKICGNYRVFCDGNLFSFYSFQSAESALNEAYRKIRYIESISDKERR